MLTAASFYEGVDEVLSGLVHVLKGTTMLMRALHKHV